MARPKVIRGGDLQVYINGKLFGITTSIHWQTDSGHRSIYGIDQYTPFEIAPGQATVKGAIDCYRLRLDGGLEGRGVLAPESKVLLEKYGSLAVVDRSTDTVILAVSGVIVSGQSWSAGAKGILSGSFNFEGTDWIGETGI